VQVVVIGIINITADGEKYNIKCIRIHPNYTDQYKNGWKHDIAVITVSSLNLLSLKKLIEKWYRIEKTISVIPICIQVISQFIRIFVCVVEKTDQDKQRARSNSFSE